MNQSINKEKQNMDIVLSFKRTFYDINNREALESEIIDNLKDKIDMSLFHNQESKDYLMIYSTPLNVQYSTLWYFILKNYPNRYLLNVKKSC